MRSSAAWFIGGLALITLSTLAAAQIMLSPRNIEDSRQFTLRCEARNIVIDRATSLRSGPRGQSKICSGAIVAPPGYAIALHGYEMKYLTRNARGRYSNNMFKTGAESIFRYGGVSCFKGGNMWGTNCGIEPVTFDQGDRFYAYAFATKMSCDTSGSSGQTAAIEGGSTLVYTLISEAEGIAKHRLGPRPATIPVHPGGPQCGA